MLRSDREVMAIPLVNSFFNFTSGTEETQITGV